MLPLNQIASIALGEREEPRLNPFPAPKIDMAVKCEANCY